MKPIVIALVAVVIAGVGVYIGLSGLSSQYAVQTGSSFAGQLACAPDQQTVKRSQTVKFTASLPEGTAYYWSAPEGQSSFVRGGPLTVQYHQAGTKVVRLYVASGGTWQSTTCTVVVK